MLLSSSLYHDSSIIPSDEGINQISNIIMNNNLIILLNLSLF